MVERAWLRWVLLILGLFLAVALGLLAYDRWLRADPASVPALSSEVTARQALPPARKLARQWEGDAELVAVSGQRTAAKMEQSVEWSFQFFSPSTRRLALITVNGKREAQLLHESVSPYKLTTFSRRDWHVDSDRALLQWWERGGAHLVKRRPSTKVVMRLRVPKEGNGAPVWKIVGFMPEQEGAFTVIVDAVDGMVIEEE